MRKVYELLAVVFFVSAVLIGGADWEGGFFPGALYVLGGFALCLAGFFLSLWLRKMAEEREK